MEPKPEFEHSTTVAYMSYPSPELGPILLLPKTIGSRDLSYLLMLLYAPVQGHG